VAYKHIQHTIEAITTIMSIKYNETKHNEDTGGETLVEPIVKASELEVDSKPAQE
jgi:hypothetical protein